MDSDRRDLSNLYKTQISLTEWLQKMKHPKTNIIREEDNWKRERLGVLNEIIGLPFDKAEKFEAVELKERNERLKNFLDERGEELCALRLVPKDPKLPKLRLRGLSVKSVMDWFDKQDINPENYEAHFVPHADDTIRSTIFVINSKGIFGEVIKGGAYQLTQGFYDWGSPVSFSYDFNEWKFSCEDEEAERYVKNVVSYLKVEDATLRERIAKELNSDFVNNYIVGYFETVESGSRGLWFIDYNTNLAEIYDDLLPVIEGKEEFLTGQPASLGKVSGKVRVVSPDEIQGTDLDNEILVCEVTTPEYFNLMQKSLGIITNFGGTLSHAGIVARELGKPCIVGTQKATEVLKTGDFVELDADNGVVRKINGLGL